MAENVLSVLLKSLGAGVGNVGQNFRADQQQQKQNALQAYTLGLQAEQQRMELEQHKQAMLLGASRLKASDLDIKRNMIALQNAAKSPEQLAKEQAEAQIAQDRMLQFEWLKQNNAFTGVPQGFESLVNSIPSSGVDFSNMNLGQLGLDKITEMSKGLPGGVSLKTPFGNVESKQFAPDNSKSNYEFIAELFGKDFLKKTLEGGNAPSPAEVRASDSAKEKSRRSDVLKRANEWWLSNTNEKARINAKVTSITNINELQQAVEYLIKSGGTVKQNGWFRNDVEDPGAVEKFNNLVREYMGSDSAVGGYGPDGSFPTEKEYLDAKAAGLAN